MPLSNYDSAFGGKQGSAAKAKASMIKQYGLKRGTEIFYATLHKRRKAASGGH